MSIFPCAFHSFQKGLPCLCPFCALCVFLWALVSKNSHLKLICFVSVSSVLLMPPMHLLVKRGFILLGLPCQFSRVLSILFTRVCLACVHSVLFVSSCGPWCQKNIILSSFALFPSPWLCPFCGLCVFLWALVPKSSHLKLICFVSVSSVLFVP